MSQRQRRLCDVPVGQASRREERQADPRRLGPFHPPHGHADQQGPCRLRHAQLALRHGGDRRRGRKAVRGAGHQRRRRGRRSLRRIRSGSGADLPAVALNQYFVSLKRTSVRFRLLSPHSPAGSGRMCDRDRSRGPKRIAIRFSPLPSGERVARRAGEVVALLPDTRSSASPSP
ncbi:protein of unknown function [Azospirillum baldaniorum]|uniref:Uncharacterized protein n=1 Tax=Azospirillum baldaniorum TaxID=1064539 RepID=A0A9P1NLW5_9PROT|nr:protein of unknown function [Azospirillum baldaniorum]